MTPQNQRFLQLTISPVEYVELVEGRFWDKKFWECLPIYLISHCPLCEAPYTSKLDPHSLYGWGTSDSDSSLLFYTEKYEQVGCDHHFRVQLFVNLEGRLPSEMLGYNAALHVPFVAPFLVPDDIRALAVIHSFAICRLEDVQGRVYDYKTHTFRQPLTSLEILKSKEFKFRKRGSIKERSAEDTAALAQAMFVPRYTAYAVTYYAEAHNTIIDRRMKPQWETYARDKEYEPAFMPSMGEMKREPHAYDLTYWVKRGKLQWLDLESPDLPLKAGPVEDFPYVNIQDDSGGLKPMRF